MDIILLTCHEHSIGEIAKKLNISTKTIELDLINIFKKMKVKNSVGLVLYAIKYYLYKPAFLQNRVYVSVKTATPKKAMPKLNETEIAIILLICQGNRNKEIAKRLGLSFRTIEGYRDIIYKKMNVDNTASLVLYAVKYGIIKI